MRPLSRIRVRGTGHGATEMIVGVVERIDDRRRQITVRERRTGRYVIADIDRVRHEWRGVDFDHLRRGDYVTLAGGWIRSDVFVADRIDGVRNGRY